jgi:quinol monooxygenase YgiN
MSAQTKFDAGTTGVRDMSTSTQKVIVAGWYSVDPGKRDGVIENFKDMVVRARSAAGCLDMAITADPVDSNRINIFEFWRSEKDLNSWRVGSHPPKMNARMRRVEVQKHTVQQSSAPFERRSAKRSAAARR